MENLQQRLFTLNSQLTDPLLGERTMNPLKLHTKILQVCAFFQRMLSCFSRVRLCATPQTAAHQAPRSWDSPGKNTGVGCHFLLQCMKVKSESEVAQSFPTLSNPMDCSLPGSSVHGIFRARVLEWGAIAFSFPITNIHKNSKTCRYKIKEIQIVSDSIFRKIYTVLTYLKASESS